MISNAVLPSPHSHQVGWPVAVMSLHVQRYKIGAHPSSVRHRPDPASCRPNLANRSTSIYGKSGSVLRIDAFLTTWPELTPFGRFTRIAQGPTLGPTPFCDPLDSVA
jgi:hypothetical protein